MRRSEPETRIEPGRTVPEGDGAESRALVVIDHRADADRARFATRRAHAGFLAHLIVSADPALAPSRSERTRAAALHYAAAGRDGVAKRVA